MNTETRELVERLRKMRSRSFDYDADEFPRIPNCAKAADLIEAQAARIAELERVAQRDAEELRLTRLKVCRQKDELNIRSTTVADAERDRIAGFVLPRSAGSPPNGRWDGMYQQGWDDAQRAFREAISRNEHRDT